MGMPVCLSPDVHAPLIRRFPSLTSPQNHGAVMVKKSDFQAQFLIE